jgi:WD40 repeat protein
MLTETDKALGYASIRAACLKPDGSMALVNWGGLSVWNGIDGENILVPYGCGIVSIAALPDGKLVLGNSVGSVLVRHESGDCFALGGFVGDFTGAVTVLTVLADGKLVAGSAANEVRAWNVECDKCLLDWRAPHRANINAIVGLPCGGVAFASGDGNVRTCTRDFEHMHTLVGHRDAVLALVALPDGQLASGSKDATVRVWGKDDCVQVLEGHALSVLSLAVLTQDRLASGSFDTTVRVWHVPTATCLFELVHARPVKTLVFLPDGQLAAGSDDIVEIWNIDRGKCAHVLKAHVGLLAHLTALPGGRLLWGTTNGMFSLWV